MQHLNVQQLPLTIKHGQNQFQNLRKQFCVSLHFQSMVRMQIFENVN